MEHWRSHVSSHGFHAIPYLQRFVKLGLCEIAMPPRGWRNVFHLVISSFYVCCNLRHTSEEENASRDCFCAGSYLLLHKINSPCNAGTFAPWCRGACIGGRLSKGASAVRKQKGVIT